MKRRLTLFAILFLFHASVGSARADEPKYDLKYQFKTGDVIRYSVLHRMNVRNTIDKETQEASSRTESIKAWRIIDVMPDGEIELINMVEQVHMTNRLPGQDELEYDSQRDAEPPPGFEDAAAAVGVPLSIIRMSPRGEIVSRELKVDQPNADPNAPITARLPDEPVAVGDAWNEPLQVTVQPKAGGTLAIEARRHYKLTAVDDNIAAIEVTYQVLSPINAYIEAQIIQRLMNGTIKFDIGAGRVIGQQMEVDKRVLGYAGNTSSMHYVMRMEETLLVGTPEVARKP